MTRVLVIDDEPQILRALRINLSVRGYEVTTVATGAAALRAAAEHRPDVIVLDLGLPDMSGIEVLDGLRGWLTAPVIVLSARIDSDDKVEALDAGADDYVTKPFRLAELLARVRARLRAAPEVDVVVTAQDVRVDTGARRAWHGDEELDLTNKEFELLALLVREAGHVLTRERIMEEVWDEHWFGSTKTLDVHVSWLRRKLGDDPTNGRYITTVRGVGLRFERGGPPAGRARDTEPAG
ncbi:MAG: response regulator transcription factor [Mycobacteriaceae bacterium]|nr:response regulator transcription factor [Mycobacteriaceae bacterium]